MRALGEPLGPSVALVGLGGYGREELCPGSDIDIMVLHRERRAERVRGAASRVFYPLWDARLQVGHAVRTPAECEAAARERIDTACSLLDARLVWGDAELFAELTGVIRRVLGRDRERFLDRLGEVTRARHEAHGSCSAMLEPDLKEGSGGLRDVHAVGWTSAIALGSSDREGLTERGVLRAREVAELDEAEEFLVRLRSGLHLIAGRRTDRLWLEHQPDLASAFGFEPEPGLEAVDALMRGLFEHARQVEHVGAAVLERIDAAVGRGARHLDVAPPSGPEAVVRAFAEAAASGLPLSSASLDALEDVPEGGPAGPWSDETRSAFLEILAAGGAGARALEAMDRGDLMVWLLPEWAGVRCRPQRDPYHRYSVDVHLLHAAAGVERLLEGGADDPLADRAAAAVRDPDVLRLGALLHDIGKRGQGGHVARGVEIAGAVLDRMGERDERRDDVLFLVREHLLLADTATRRDLSDENLVLDVAARIGTPERLAMLYLLTIADADATGPHARTPWRLALVRELVAKVERVLERGEMGSDGAAALEERLAAVRALLRQEDAGAVSGYLERMPRAYLLAVPPEIAARHFDIVTPPPPTVEVRTDARRGERPGTYDVAVVAADRPGLLAKIAGALALSGLNILSAQAFTTEDGIAVDLFVVEPRFEGDVDEERWRRFRSDLRKALSGRISLEYRVREKRRHYRAPRAPVPTEVTVSNDGSDFFTIVEVSAGDRIGLLFDLARTLHDLELDVHLAKVATYGQRVVDAFYVRDLLGQKVEDPEHVREIERAITAGLEEAG